MTRLLALLIFCLLVTPVVAQTVSTLPGADTRLQTVRYDPNRVVTLRVPMGYQTTIILDPNEQIENVAIGDSSAWQVTPNTRGDHLFVKPLDSGRNTNLTVVTDTRIYSFDLSAAYGPTAETPFTLKFVYPDVAAPASPSAASVPAVTTGYRLSGAPGLRPTAVSDDGVRTFIAWPPGKDLPAVFALDERNREVLVTGYIREDRFVIDAVYATLLFRLDRQVARAARMRTGEGR